MKTRFSALKLFLIFSVLIFVSSCKTTQVEDIDETIESYELSDWTEVQDGVETLQFADSKVKWACIRLDFNKIKAAPVVYPEKVPAPAISLKSFAGKNHTTAAINTTPFAIAKHQTKPVGITKYNDEILTEPVRRYAALGINLSDDDCVESVAILPKQIESQINEHDFVIGGFYIILLDKEIHTYKKSLRPRSVCGTNEDGTVLYLFATNKMTYEQCAQILLNLGCNSAFQFDGGHSTGLYLGSKVLLKSKAQRKVSSALGFKILP